jgi:hypothetical protein
MRVGPARLDPTLNPYEESSAARWIRQRAQALIESGVAVPAAFGQARTEHAELALREGTKGPGKPAPQRAEK